MGPVHPLQPLEPVGWKEVIPSIPPPPRQPHSCMWLCHRGVVEFLALIQKTGEVDLATLQPQQLMSYLTPGLTPFLPAPQQSRAHRQPPCPNQLPGCIYKLCCLTLALRNHQSKEALQIHGRSPNQSLSCSQRFAHPS